MGDLVYRCVIAASRAVFRGLGLRVELRGEEHPPTTGGAVIASNHLSFLDFTFLGLVGVERGRLVRLRGDDPGGRAGVLRARIHDQLAQASGGGTAPTPEVARVLEDAALWGTGGASPKAPSAGRDTQMNSG